MYRVQSTEYRVQSTEYRVQSTEYRVQSTEYRVQSTEYRVQSTEYNQVLHYKYADLLLLALNINFVRKIAKAAIENFQFTFRKVNQYSH